MFCLRMEKNPGYFTLLLPVLTPGMSGLTSYP